MHWPRRFRQRRLVYLTNRTDGSGVEMVTRIQWATEMDEPLALCDHRNNGPESKGLLIA